MSKHWRGLVDRTLPYVPLIFDEAEVISMLEARLQARQFFAAQYHADLEDSLAAAPEEMVSIYTPARNLDGESD